MDHRRRTLWAFAVVGSIVLLIAPAIWNGFPLLQYDTGGYLAPWFDHKLEVNRAVAYGVLLVAGAPINFWPVPVVQAALTVWVLALTMRAHGLGNRPGLLFIMVVTLSVLTTLPWLTAILLTDIFAGLSVLALYLLLLRDDALTRNERFGLVLLVAFSAATHSATMLVLLGLVAVAAVVWIIDSTRIPYLRLLRATAALLLGTLMGVTANGLVAGRFAWAPGGYALSFGRMLEDGIVKKYLDDHCPDASLRLCPYKNEMPRDADDFFWGGGVFNKLGRFDGLDDEMRRIVLASLAEYPALQIESAASETAKQFVQVETGAGVVKWAWDTYFAIKDHVPAAVPAMRAARQQRSGISFAAINLLQVPVAWFAMALLPFIAAFALRRPSLHDIGEFAAAITFTILGNAAVFGLFATAHNRYGARMVWLAVLVVLIALARMLLSRSRGEAPGLPA